MAEMGDLVEEVYVQASVMLGSMTVTLWRVEVDERGRVVALHVVTGGFADRRSHRAAWSITARGNTPQLRKRYVRDRLAELRAVLTG